MYSELDRSWLRWALGYAAIFVQADPSFETALQASQSLTDGGSRPDSTTENFCKGLIYGFAAVTGTAGVTPGPTVQNVTFTQPQRRGLLTLWATLDQLDAYAGALEVDSGEAKVDAFREMVRLQREGRRLVHTLARMLSTNIVADIFGPGEIDPSGNWLHFNRPATAFSGYAALLNVGG